MMEFWWGLPVVFQVSRNKRNCGARTVSHQVVLPSENRESLDKVRLM